MKIEVNSIWAKIPLGDVLKKSDRWIKIQPNENYKQITVRLWGKGVTLRGQASGAEIAASEMLQVQPNQFILSRIDARNGAYGLIPELVSNDFPVYDIDTTRLLPAYIRWMSKTRDFVDFCKKASEGTTNRVRLKEDRFLSTEISLPLLEEQRRIVAKIDELAAKIGEARGLQQRTIEDAWTLLESTRANIFKKMSSSWKVKKLDEVAPINMGQSPPGESYNTFADGIPLLNGPTEFGEKYPTPVQWTTAPTKLCKPGDILLCVRGATTGRLNWADKEYCIGRGLAALTPKSELGVPEYVYHFVETQTQEMLGLAAGSTFPNLPGAKLKVLEIPVPPILEQRRVVAYLDSIQEKIKPLRYLQSQTATELEALLPSILDEAFKGER